MRNNINNMAGTRLKVPSFSLLRKELLAVTCLYYLFKLLCYANNKKSEIKFNAYDN